MLRKLLRWVTTLLKKPKDRKSESIGWLYGDSALRSDLTKPRGEQYKRRVGSNDGKSPANANEEKSSGIHYGGPSDLGVEPSVLSIPASFIEMDVLKKTRYNASLIRIQHDVDAIMADLKNEQRA